MDTRAASQRQLAEGSELARAAVVIHHGVEDYTAWKRAFDRHAGARRNAGVVAAHVNQDAENPNRLSVYLAASDRAKLAAFVGDIALMATMREAGVTGPPHIIDLTPVEDLTCKDRPLAGLIIRHEVRDYAAWKAAFDGHGDARREAGVVGHAVSRSVRDPNVVVIYLQAASLEALRAFAVAPDLKTVMQAAGVVGAPDLSFVHGGAWQT
jgi:quinol monooxygenase YgiN